MEITLLYELTRAQTSCRQALRYLSQVVTHLHLISTSLQYFSIILLFSVSHYLYIVLLMVVLSPRHHVFTESPINSLVKYLLAISINSNISNASPYISTCISLYLVLHSISPSALHISRSASPLNLHLHQPSTAGSLCSKYNLHRLHCPYIQITIVSSSGLTTCPYRITSHHKNGHASSSASLKWLCQREEQTEAPLSSES